MKQNNGDAMLFGENVYLKLRAHNCHHILLNLIIIEPKIKIRFNPIMK